MKTLVIYDSQYGNTQQVAAAVAETLGPSTEVSLKSVTEAALDDLEQVELLIVGSPTHGGRPTSTVYTWLSQIPAEVANSFKFACFDTRITVDKLHSVIRLLLNIIGYAAPKMSSLLKAKGAQEVAGAAGFLVEGKEGPLVAGELDRARDWAQTLLQEYD